MLIIDNELILKHSMFMIINIKHSVNGLSGKIDAER